VNRVQLFYLILYLLSSVIHFSGNLETATWECWQLFSLMGSIGWGAWSYIC